MLSTQIKKKLDSFDFIKLINKFSEEQIECTKHTFFRLSEKQREIYTCNKLKKILLNEKPFLVGLQYNGNHSIFYEYENKNLKIIVNLDDGKIKIVTFYFIKEWQIPKI